MDQRLTNLERFPQFFPEKRDFFLDGSTFFDFQSSAVGVGAADNTLLPFFTRRIGLDAVGDPQKLNVGGKLAGQFGRNDVGALYVRTGRESAAPGLSYTKRPRNHAWIRTVQFGTSGNFLIDTRDAGLLNRDVDVTMINLGTHRQDAFQMHVLPSFERLERDFTIRPGITLPAGTTYTWNRYRFQLTTAPRRIVAVNPIYEVGSFYNGTRRRVAMDLNIRLRPGVIIYTSGEWNNVDLDQGSFSTRLYRVVPELQFSPWLAWVNNVQYDTQSAILGWQSRFRWILKPGNDFYIVYTHNWLDDPLENRTYTLERRFASKILYTRRF